MDFKRNDKIKSQKMYNKSDYGTLQTFYTYEL